MITDIVKLDRVIQMNEWLFYKKNTHRKWSCQTRIEGTVECLGWQSWFIDNKHKLSLSFTIRCLLMVSFCLFALVFIKLGKCQHCIMFLCLHGVARRLKQCLFVCFPFSPTRLLLWARVKERCRETFPIYKFSPFSEYAISFWAKSFVFPHSVMH